MIEFKIMKTTLVILLFVIFVSSCTTPAESNTSPISVTIEPTNTVTNVTQTPLPPYLPISSDGALIKANALIDSADLLAIDKSPIEIQLILGGYLPTPCHELRVDIPSPDDEGNIMVETYSVTEPDVDCPQVLKAFDTKVILGSYPPGSYWVWINGDRIGNFDT